MTAGVGGSWLPGCAFQAFGWLVRALPRPPFQCWSRSGVIADGTCYDINVVFNLHNGEAIICFIACVSRSLEFTEKKSRTKS